MISEAAATGDRIQALTALRDRLAVDLDECRSARDVAALSQRLMDVLAQIETAQAAKPEAKGTPLDELKKRRAQRTANA